MLSQETVHRRDEDAEGPSSETTLITTSSLNASKRLASPPEARGGENGQTQESCVYTGETGADSKISESGATEKGSLFVVPFATGCGLCDPKYQPPTEDW